MSKESIKKNRAVSMSLERIQLSSIVLKEEEQLIDSRKSA